MNRPRIGLLSKPRGNFALQARYVGPERVVDTTSAEVEHHRLSLKEAGYPVVVIPWGPDIIERLGDADVELVFNVSSLVEAALLEELEIPYVGSDPFGIALATDKSLAKRLWQHAGLPTSPFVVATSVDSCAAFAHSPPFPYPLFIKPVAGRGSAGIDHYSVVHDYEHLVSGVALRLEMIRQPVLIERFLQGREVTIGVVGNGAQARALPLLEIRYAPGDVTLTYDKKEKDDDTFLCPAPLDPALAAQMRQLGLQAFDTLGLRDYGRIDTILTPEGPFLLEANSFAGLTCTPPHKPHSYIGFMARAEGKGGPQLLDEIVQAALARLRATGGRV